MTAYEMSPFHNGVWIWNETENCLEFECHDPVPRATLIDPQAKIKLLKPPKGTPTEVRFRDTVESIEQIRFRRFFQRVCKIGEPEVITVQDIKDVVLFTTHPRDITLEFLVFFHTPTMDKFLRALIVYFQYYITIWEKVLIRREEKSHKLYQPIVTVIEATFRDDLADLRCIVAREYGRLILGIEDAVICHHMIGHSGNSLVEKDRRMYETLICFAIRVVWTALQRKYLGLIELEFNRLLRCNLFNIIVHRPNRSLLFDPTPDEVPMLCGLAATEEKKLYHRSPCIKEILLIDHDHRLLSMGIKHFPPENERSKYLELAFTAPEELLLENKVRVGLLGIPRKEFDPMLTQRERTSKTFKLQFSEAPEFVMPVLEALPDGAIPAEFPTSPPRYTETEQAARSRMEQKKSWTDALIQAAGRSHF